MKKAKKFVAKREISLGFQILLFEDVDLLLSSVLWRFQLQF